ncbi:hypothetical protein [Bifidobacterium eulemuris]|uniref:Uncharacterized protein n=1 Tax=Bifidobacterium eulemuris TaxID=1765219 RepID=A0A261G9X5_9BIFI|nr:hypothetical protein [Bifidobacterium eulemuris]OZG68232.1 hypothetical protein BEUL_1245 [Bifidobacterium eulemuris]QOL31711.1 hypothetical protein BE0216_03965 [Bifidobacterium eulemuris]
MNITENEFDAIMQRLHDEMTENDDAQMNAWLRMGFYICEYRGYPEETWNDCEDELRASMRRILDMEDVKEEV